MLLPRPVASLASRSRLCWPPHARTLACHNARLRSPSTLQMRCVSQAVEQPAIDKGGEMVAEAILDIPWGMFELLHSAGLPWAVALPAGAVVVRALVVMPFFQIPARKAQQRSSTLMPLSHAYAILMKHRSHQLFYSSGPRHARTVARNLLAGYNASMRKRWLTERWRQMLPVAGVPIFVVVAEVIRRMAGAKSGLLGLIFGSPSSASGAAETAGAQAAGQAADGATDALDAVAQWKGTTSLPSSVPDTAVFSDWLEPSFAREGALWFPNLMLPDPLMILPFVVSGITLASLYRGSKPVSKDTEKPVGMVLRRILMTVALAIGPMTLHMPAGILLYWTASTSCAFLAHIYLDKYYPLRMPPKPCKRSIMPYPKNAQNAKKR
ncbi:Membrane insertion protein OxaA/YidC [Neofusicoccum parvum]|uniref:Membrane insertion protein OxaA/YidC n=1 Tax=Neofusicoccum parvum TaxID=310453 RepID=A0ACB5SDG0_9PEZI|nr:Membrane insertion protein OxaA/YidC [Neofusicoccum parvum]